MIPRILRSSLIACCLIACCGPGPSQAQNLLVNGGFDVDLSGWSFDPLAPAPFWEDIDIDDLPGSGAVRVTNEAAEPLARIFPLEQCVHISAPGLYRVIAHGYIPSGQGGGKLVVNFALALNATDCSMPEGVQAVGGQFLTTIDGWGRYDVLVGTRVTSPVPPNAMMKVRLGIEKDAAGGSFHGFFDAVTILREPVIFRSDFE